MSSLVQVLKKGAVNIADDSMMYLIRGINQHSFVINESVVWFVLYRLN